MRVDFQDRHVAVTGGTGALGGAVVRRLLQCGAVCHVPCRGEAIPALFPFRDHPQVRTVAGVDLRREVETERFYQGLPDLWASIHCVGGFSMSLLTETSLQDFSSQFELNVVTSFLCCREAVRKMKDSGDGGRIVNVGARAGMEPRSGAGLSAYVAAKAAVAAMTVSLAEELAGDGIWVNAVAPSVMDTPENRKAMPDAEHADWPSVDSVADAIVYLASPENRAVRGAVVTAYGRS